VGGNQSSSLKTTICFVVTGGGKSEAHARYKEVVDADIGQAKLVNHVTLARDYIQAGGKPVNMQNSATESNLTIHEFSGAKNTVAVQGKYEERIYHPDHPKPTLDILARQINANPGGTIVIPLEPEGFALIPEFKNDPRFKNVVIAFARPENDRLSEDCLDKRYEKRGNNDKFREQKRKDFSPFMQMVDKLCAENPEHKQIILKKTKHLIDGVLTDDIEYLSEALIREGFKLTELTSEQQKEKGMPPTSVFFANLHKTDEKVSDKKLPLILGGEMESNIIENKLLTMQKQKDGGIDGTE